VSTHQNQLPMYVFKLSKHTVYELRRSFCLYYPFHFCKSSEYQWQRNNHSGLPQKQKGSFKEALHGWSGEGDWKKRTCYEKRIL